MYKKALWILCATAIGVALFFFKTPPKKEFLPPFVSFEHALTQGKSDAIDLAFGKKKKTIANWKLLRNLYETHLLAKTSSSPRIPKIIHQIWIGGSLPAKYTTLQESWKKHHPDWEYRLWTDADLVNFPFQDKARFDTASNLGEKSDILRYEILYRYGGLYVDTDFECVKPFDILHNQCDFYVGVEDSSYKDGFISIGNALIGSIPHHPILSYCLTRISEQKTDGNPDKIQEITGPQCLKHAFFQKCREGNLRNVAFPCSYFYPLPSEKRAGLLPPEGRDPWIHPETFGIHYWDSSWIPSSEKM